MLWKISSRTATLTSDSTSHLEWAAAACRACVRDAELTRVGVTADRVPSDKPRGVGSGAASKILDRSAFSCHFPSRRPASTPRSAPPPLLVLVPVQIPVREPSPQAQACHKGAPASTGASGGRDRVPGQIGEALRIWISGAHPWRERLPRSIVLQCCFASACSGRSSRIL
jgi:hypothetical protein